MIEAVFFDLDGTLADTAPDLAAALNKIRLEEGHPPLPPHVLRPFTSHGVRGLLGAGLQIKPDDSRYPDFAHRFLCHYETTLCADTRLFPGMAELIDEIEARGICWGVVTNKTSRFTLPLLDALGLARRARCMVSGDSAPRAKPHPDPLLLAAELCGVAPAACLYAGDDLRDIQAAASAGMKSAAAAYGYLGADKPVTEWAADHLVSQPAEFVNLLPVARCKIDGTSRGTAGL